MGDLNPARSFVFAALANAPMTWKHYALWLIDSGGAVLDGFSVVSLGIALGERGARAPARADRLRERRRDVVASALYWSLQTARQRAKPKLKLDSALIGH